jgi:hypothetical protein
MIRDGNGEELLYWPITALRAGQDSQVLHGIRVDTPDPGLLQATEDERAIVYISEAGVEDYIDLAQNPIDLSARPGPYAAFDVYVHAVEDTGPFERVGLEVGPARSSAAGWSA